ncbi:MAG TPA: VCBS repeat-containing protein [Candidatus Limnocylindrales bacterium]
MPSSNLAKVGLALAIAVATVAATPAAALAYQVAPCSSSGPSAADGVAAARLNPLLQAKMRGHMTAYRVSCARKVVQAVAARGLHQRAAVIAMTTVIVESSIDNVSETVDHDSLGLFQQRASWGSVSQRLNPTWATNAFLNRMLALYPNNSWMNTQIGVVCQAVQVSAFPERYQPQAGDAHTIVDLLWGRQSRDFDGDGDADVIARNAASKDLVLYRGNGASGFSTSTVIGNNWAAFDMVFSTGDFSGDGNADVVARHATTKDLHLYRGNGVNGFTGSVMIGNNWGAFDRIFSAGDFDRDGDVDLIARHATTKDLHLYRGNGTNGFSGSTMIGNNWAAFDILFSPGDFSGDGNPDVIARHAATKDLHLYRGNGANGFSGSTMIGNNWSAFDMIFSVGDFSGDGRADVIGRNTANKDLFLYRGNGLNGFTGSGMIGNNWSAFDMIF